MPTVVINTLEQFYEAMSSTIPVRRALTEDVLASRPVLPSMVDHLRGVLAGLQSVPVSESGPFLVLQDDRTIRVDLSYEIEELKKDLVMLDDGEQALLDDLAARHQSFRAEVEMGREAIGGRAFQALVTDRDGTVNNYCGRYASSVQSMYNAVFLTRFARARTRRSVIVTSAPLADIGVVDVTVAPPGAMVMAGSKGREYVDAAGRHRRYPIDRHQRQLLDDLNDRLDELLRLPRNEIFEWIGSGCQRKFGETTIAYQDITGIVDVARSRSFRSEVHNLVASLDPSGSVFHVEDTGLDVEVTLTIDDAGGTGIRPFDKGDGVRFLNHDLELDMSRGACIVCGDTSADLLMMHASRQLASSTVCIFVTSDDGRRRQVADMLPGTLFFSEPDNLVGTFAYASRS